jgi:hypothetical protein
MLEEFFKKAKVPKLANTNYHPIISMTKKLLKDSNVNIIGLGLRVLTTLSKGLRKHFSFSAKNLTPLVL